jgi:hypothetical protein
VISVQTVRIVTLVICVAGIAGMIVTSILNHNGAAVTFGLVTAVAVLCSMVAKSVAADTTRRLSAVPSTGSTSDTDPAPALAAVVPPSSADTEALAAVVEGQLQVIVAGGADEATMRQLVGEAVRLGRNLAAGEPAKGPH